MNFSYKPAVLLLCFLGLCAVHSLPAPSGPLEGRGSRQPLEPRLENARQMWNGAKKAMRRLGRRTVRQVEGDEQPPLENVEQEIPNIAGEKFIVDLYKNLTNSVSTVQRATQANTIRSLKYNRGVHPSCGVFNFSLTALNSTEFVINAELMLYTSQHPFSSTYFVEVVASHSSPVESSTPEGRSILGKLRFIQEVELRSAGYITFSVLEMTKTLIQLGERYAIFQVKLFKDDPKVNDKASLPCTEIKFVDRDFTDDTKPTYIVYSYNLDIENINYNSIADGVILSMLQEEQTGEAVNQVGVNRRRKRAVPHCKVNDLIVPGSSIHKEMVGSTAEEFIVVHPPSYNAGICGGSCDVSIIPSTDSGHHAPFVYLLLEQQAFRETHGYTFQRCCAPVKYSPETIFSTSDGAAQINVLNDLKIARCECLDIIVL